MTDKLEMANKFNACCTNIGNHLAHSIKYKGFHDHSYHLNKKVNSVFTFNEIEEYTVKRIINNLPNKSSCGFDGFSTKLLKLIEPAITKSLTLLSNQVLTTGVFPDKLNIAKLIPIYKKVRQQYFIIIDLYLFYQLSQKYWNKLFIINCHLI